MTAYGPRKAREMENSYHLNNVTATRNWGLSYEIARIMTYNTLMNSNERRKKEICSFATKSFRKLQNRLLRCFLS